MEWEVELRDEHGEPSLLRMPMGVNIGSSSQHVRAVRVEFLDCMAQPSEEAEQTAINDMGILEAMRAGDQPNEPYESSQIVGFEGEWVVICTPYCN